MGKKKKRGGTPKKKRSKPSKQKKQQNTKTPSPNIAMETSFPDFGMNVFRPSMSEMNAPEGFRSIGMAQAMMEYAKPLMELESKGGDLNDLMQLSTALWNYALVLEKGEKDKKAEKLILNIFIGKFGLKSSEADDLLQQMIERRSYLFPPEIQPKYPMIMFIKKEVSETITPFDYGCHEISEEVIPPSVEEKKLIEDIKKLDELIDGADYEDYEDLLFRASDEAQELFGNWLTEKGMKRDVDLLASCLNIYFTFIYGYAHSDTLSLKFVPRRYFEEFFKDFLLRKVMVKPNEYTYWPPALKFFYLFLHEKEYFAKPAKRIIKNIESMEPCFIKILSKHFA